MALPTLHVSALHKLQDKEPWVHRFQVVSVSSGSTYIIAQHSHKRHWACSCRAWTTKRKCKHLTTQGLPNHEEAHEVNFVVVPAGNASPVQSGPTHSTPKTNQAAPVLKVENSTPLKTKRAISFEDI